MPRGNLATRLAARLPVTLSVVRDGVVNGTVSARIDVHGSASEVAGAAAVPGRTLATVYLDDAADVKKGDQFVDGDGTRYEVEMVQTQSDITGVNVVKVAWAEARQD